VRNPIRNETSLVLVVAVVFSAVAIPVLSGFLEPSQPPAVAAVQIGDPRESGARDDSAAASERDRSESEVGDGRSPARRQVAPSAPSERPTQPAPAPPRDEAGEEDDED
jgi:hypothetical protein